MTPCSWGLVTGELVMLDFVMTQKRKRKERLPSITQLTSTDKKRRGNNKHKFTRMINRQNPRWGDEATTDAAGPLPGNKNSSPPPRVLDCYRDSLESLEPHPSRCHVTQRRQRKMKNLLGGKESLPGSRNRDTVFGAEDGEKWGIYRGNTFRRVWKRKKIMWGCSAF